MKTLKTIVNIVVIGFGCVSAFILALVFLCALMWPSSAYPQVSISKVNGTTTYKLNSPLYGQQVYGGKPNNLLAIGSDGLTMIPVSDVVKRCDLYVTGDASRKLNDCVMDVIESGGTMVADARMLGGNQTISERVNIGAQLPFAILGTPTSATIMCPMPNWSFVYYLNETTGQYSVCNGTSWGSPQTVNAWSSGTTYAAGNLVTYGDSFYLAAYASTGIAPDTASTGYWQPQYVIVGTGSPAASSISCHSSFQQGVRFYSPQTQPYPVWVAGTGLLSPALRR